jgi:hypothetical protein
MQKLIIHSSCRESEESTSFLSYLKWKPQFKWNFHQDYSLSQHVIILDFKTFSFLLKPFTVYNYPMKICEAIEITDNLLLIDKLGVNWLHIIFWSSTLRGSLHQGQVHRLCHCYTPTWNTVSTLLMPVITIMIMIIRIKILTLSHFFKAQR